MITDEMRAAWDALTEQQKAHWEAEIAKVEAEFATRATKSHAACLDGCDAMLHAMLAMCDSVTPPGHLTDQSCAYAAEVAADKCRRRCDAAAGQQHGGGEHVEPPEEPPSPY